jgi:ABC-type glycerol-3-phosphate transport system permease component
MFVPLVVILVPLYLLVSKARLIDTYAGSSCPGLFRLHGFFWCLSSARSPKTCTIRQAGRLRLLSHHDARGRSQFQVGHQHGHSVLVPGPLEKLHVALIVTNKQQYRTLPIGLKYLVQVSSSEYQVMMAASVMAILPVLVVFMVFERQLVKSVTLTGLKA